jgi:phospholipid-translocating ATPase
LITGSQFIPILRVGFLFTYVAPLAFVLVITLINEAIDDIKRY